MSQLIAQGRRGTITLTTDDTYRTATKTARTPAAKGAITKEQEILRYLQAQKIDFVPQLQESGDDWFSYPRIEWVHFQDAYKHASPNLKKKLIDYLLERAYQLDKIGVVHGELNTPTTNVLVDLTQAQPIFLIDFERGMLRDFSGKNMRSLAQWMRSEGYITMSVCKQLGDLSIEEIFSVLHRAISSSSSLSNYLTTFLMVAGAVLLDLVSKYLFYNLQRGVQLTFITPVLNPGVGRSLPVPLAIVGVITVVVIGCVIVARQRGWLQTMPVVFLLAGALGNGYDRIVYEGVRDFIDLHYRPIFNGADIYLTIAILLLLYQTFRRRHAQP